MLSPGRGKSFGPHEPLIIMKNLILLLTATLALHLATAAGAPAAASAAVFDNYFNIQTALAQDSLETVAVNARAIANLVRQDTSGALRPELASVAEALATANDLPTARQIFKAVSGYLIVMVRAGNGPGGAIREAHDPVYNVNWLQQDGLVQNPYLGKSGLHVGTFVN
jgi:hypothetical protein